VEGGRGEISRANMRVECRASGFGFEHRMQTALGNG
jgi:hypothetical protein